MQGAANCSQAVGDRCSLSSLPTRPFYGSTISKNISYTTTLWPCVFTRVCAHAQHQNTRPPVHGLHYTCVHSRTHARRRAYKLAAGAPSPVGGSPRTCAEPCPRGGVARAPSGSPASKAPADARMCTLTPSLRRGGAGGMGHRVAHAHGVRRWRGQGGRGARGGAGAVRRPRQCVCEALTGSKWRQRLLCEEGKRVPGGERAGG